MKILKTALLVALVSILALWLALAAACGDDDDDDDDDASDVCADFCEIIAHCDMGEDLDIYTMDECLDFCLQVGSVGNCVMAAADCEEARACFEDQGDDDTEDTCSEDEIWDEQLGECIPSECGLDQYPAAPFNDKALLYVDAAYTGDSDGSTEKPFKTIVEALANAGEDTSILIASGDYVTTETLTIDKDGLGLVGRCSYLTKARSAEGVTIVRVDDSSSNLIREIAFYAEGESNFAFPMIRLSGTSETDFSDNSVMDSMGKGLSANSCDGILISNNVFKNNSEGGIYFLRASGTISGNHVYDNVGSGVWGLDSEGVLILDNIVEGNTEAGIVFVNSSGTISGNEVRDTMPNGQGKYGRGIAVQDSEQVVVEANIVEGNTEGGIVFDTASGTISGNTVRDNFNRGINIQDSEQVSVSDNIVERNIKVGILFSSASGSISGNIVEGNTEQGIYLRHASGTISENEVRDTDPNEQGQYGRGIAVQDCEQIVVEDNIVEGNSETGLFFDTASGTISGNEVRDNVMRGINVQNSEQVLVSDNIVEGNTDSGIGFFNSIGTISGNEVRDTGPDEQGEFGRGISILDTEHVSVLDNIVEGNSEVGICFDNSAGTISGNEVRGTLPSSPNEDGYTFGHGIHVQESTDVECSLNILENNVHAGIFYINTESGNIFENQVSSTTAGLRDAFNFGDGIVVLDAEGFTSIQDNTLDGNDRCGILSDSSTGMIERNGIFGNENSVVAQNDSDMDVSDNDIHDNDIDIVQFFEGRELSVSDSMIERNGLIPES
jgi:parallel beta-helix repeat protein